MAACLGIWSAATPQAAVATGGWRLVRGERGRDGLVLSACAGRTYWRLVCCTTAGSSGGRAGGRVGGMRSLWWAHGDWWDGLRSAGAGERGRNGLLLARLVQY
ncbi:unnamed protein product [Closterium sp. NIES-54]